MMKKFTLILVALISASFLWSQTVVFEEDFSGFGASGDPPPTGWTGIDADGNTSATFYTDQGIFGSGTWEHVFFGGDLLGIWSLSSFTTPGTAEDYLVTPMITLTSNPVLEFETWGNTTDVLEVRIATSLAGATPVASDFTTVLGTYSPDNAFGTWTLHPGLDLSTFGGMGAYLAFVNVSNDEDIHGFRNMRIVQIEDEDVRSDAIDLAGAEEYMTDYLVADIPYAVYGCEGPAAESVSITFTNVGVNDITSFTAYYIIDSLGAGTPVSEAVTPGSPITAGSSYTHTFTTTADLFTAGDAAYTVDAWVEIPGEDNPANDSTFIVFAVTPPAHDLAAAPFSDNFEQADFTVGQFQNIETSWAWTFENTNADAQSMIISAALAGDGDGFAGSDFAMQYFWNNDGTTAADDWAFSPCIIMEAGKTYDLTFQARVGDDGAGNAFPENLEVGVGTSTTSASMTIAKDFGALSNNAWQEYSACITVPANGNYNLGFHCNSPADRFFLQIDNVLLEEASGSAPTAAMSVAGTDETGPFVEYCDGDVQFSDASMNATEWSWDFNGDGTEDAVGPGPHPYNYGSNGTYTAELTVTNCSGSNTTTETIQVTDIPAPTVTITSSSIDQVTGQAIIGYVYTPDCGGETIIVGWGDGTTDALSNHTYSSLGTYDVTITVQNATGIGQADVTFGYVDVSEIEFLGNLSMYPNPTNNVLNVAFELAQLQDVELTIKSITGSEVDSRSLTASSVNETFNVSSLSNGIYILEVKADDAVSTRKFTVNK